MVRGKIPRQGIWAHICILFNTEAKYSLNSALANHKKYLAAPSGKPCPLSCRANMYSNGDPTAKMLSATCYTNPSASTTWSLGRTTLANIVAEFLTFSVAILTNNDNTRNAVQYRNICGRLIRPSKQCTSDSTIVFLANI